MPTRSRACGGVEAGTWWCLALGTGPPWESQATGSVQDSKGPPFSDCNGQLPAEDRENHTLRERKSVTILPRLAGTCCIYSRLHGPPAVTHGQCPH